MSYISDRIGIIDAVAVLTARGYTCAPEQLLQALKDGQIEAWGIVDGSRRQIFPQWWHHINSPLDMDVVWFDEKSTEPPTPWRAEAVDLPKVDLDRLWSEPEKPSTSISARLPKATLKLLLPWAQEKWPDGKFPPRKALKALAEATYSDVSEKRHIRELRKSASKESRRGGRPMHKTSQPT